MLVIDKVFKFIEKKRYANLVRRLLQCGIGVKVVFDIGANKGRWTRQHKRLIPNAKFFMFEANSKHEKKLKKVGERYFLEVLSADGMPADFYRINGTGDSLYIEKTAHYSAECKVRVNTRMLGQLCADENIPKPDFIKLDVQGAELDILLGAGSILQDCSLVLMECPIADYNEGAPSLSEYVDFMKARNFHPVAISEQHTRGYQLLQMDVMFIRGDLRDKLL